MTDEPCYYRGTTEGWPGNPRLRDEQITCTSTDPIVATLFAILCRNHGRSIILMVPIRAFESPATFRNHKDRVECAVNLLVSPTDFASQASHTIEVDRSIEILAELGHRWLPARLGGPITLGQILDESHHDGLRLSSNQIELFNRWSREER